MSIEPDVKKGHFCAQRKKNVSILNLLGGGRGDQRYGEVGHFSHFQLLNSVELVEGSLDRLDGVIKHYGIMAGIGIGTGHETLWDHCWFDIGHGTLWNYGRYWYWS